MPPIFENALQIWTVAWHLVMVTASALTAALAREIWQKRVENRFRMTWITFVIISLIQTVLALLTLAVGIPMPLTRALDTACALLVGWGLAAPFLSPLISHTWLTSALVADAALGALSLSLWGMSGSEAGWTVTLWGLFSALGVGAGAVALFRKSKETRFLVGALAGLGLGALLWTLGIEIVGRAVWLAAFITLPVGVMRWMLRDLESAERELQMFSQHALRQTQELLVLLRTSTTLVAQTNVSMMLNDAVEGIALGAGADTVIIALIADDPDKTVGVMAIYPPRAIKESIAFPLNSHVVVSQAVHDNKQLVLEPNLGLEQHVLYRLLGGKEAGPAIVQPMTCQDRTLGVIIVGNVHNNEPLGEGAGRLLGALGAQIATAVENVQMYHRLNAQAKELAHLLTIREEEASQRAAILESIADGVIVTDKNDKIIMANAAAATILGLARSELIDRSSEEVFNSGIPLPLGVFRVSDDASVLETLRMEFKIGERTVQSSQASVQTPSGELLGVVAVLRDVTRERQAELAKTEFIATISHELRTPLTSIKGYAELMNSGVTGPLSEAQQGFVGKICNQSEHLTSLINKVIQYSELERGSLVTARQPFNMQDVVSAALESVRQRIDSSKFQVVLTAPPDTPQVYADAGRTRQIIYQLLDNALRFTPEHGRITLSIQPSFENPTDNFPSHVTLSVSDTGVGIATQDIERIFERFYRADNPMQVTAGGLGLGLTVARALAVAQAGQLEATSPAIDRPADEITADYPGSTFTLRLPAYIPEKGRARA